MANRLPELERKYNNLKGEVDWLEVKKQSLVRMLHDYNGQITSLGITLDSYLMHCEKERKKFADLRAKRIKENITKSFQNDNAKIRKIAEDKAHGLLSNRRGLLKLAALCKTEDPEKYSSLVQQDKSSSAENDYAFSDFDPLYMYGKPYRQSQL